MARHWFGQSLTDWTMTLDGSTTSGGVTTAPVLAAGPAEITFWSAAIGGVRYTDLLDAADNAISAVTSSDGSDGRPVGTIPEFQGPDNDATVLWADAGVSTRYKMVATDIGGLVTDMSAQVATLVATTAELDGSPAWVRRDPATGAWPERPATGRMVFWLDTLPEAPSPPVIGGTGMVNDLDLYLGSA
ncbi:hypothetical protein [Actinomadura geliboluensis]|uniref:hypothetical protein n=1 Tax=Actinomadura geliboluensis TaxID=882440 RepID=UPI0036808577